MRVSRTDESAVLAALLRTDLRFFVWKCFQTISPCRRYDRNWHIDAMIYKLLQVRDGEINRLLINVPPRSLKTICVSVAYVAWLLGHDPTRRIIVASYSNELAAEPHRQFRMVIDAAWFRNLFPAMRAAKDTGTELVTTAGACRYATSLSTVTGRGADLIVVDDPLKYEEAISEVARNRAIDDFQAIIPRLNDKKRGAIVVTMQRLHEDDLAGHLLREGNWCHLDLPAVAVEDSVIAIGRNKVVTRRVGDVLHPERESREVLERLKQEMGSLKFSAQYQQRPVPEEGNLIQRR